MHPILLWLGMYCLFGVVTALLMALYNHLRGWALKEDYFPIVIAWPIIVFAFIVGMFIRAGKYAADAAERFDPDGV